MAARAHVCVVSTSHTHGGAEGYLARVVDGLGEQFEFSALVPTDADARTLAALSEAGARLEPVSGLRRLFSVGGILGVTRALRRLRPDVLHVNLTDQRDGATPLLAAKARGVPTVATLNLVIPIESDLKERLAAVSLRRADAVIAVSNAVGGYLRQMGIEPRTVRQGLAPPQGEPDARALLGLQPDELVVGGIGRLHQQKGWDLLCDAAQRVRASRSDVRFVVIGDGPAGDELGSMPSCTHVEFVGARADAGRLVGAFDVLAVPSRYEAFGLVALEAMLSEVPVVAARVDGLAEVCEGAARLVPPEDPDALAEALLALIGDERSRRAMAADAREHAVRSFGLERMLRETQAVYRELCA